MIVCLDTNILVQALAEKHPYNKIMAAWMAGEYALAISTEVLLEYEEVLTRLSGPARWRKLARLIDLAELTQGNVIRVNPAFRFQIVIADPDDNKFTDCAITADADYIITEDQHLDILRVSGYKPKPIMPAEFIAKFTTRSS